MDTGNQEQEFFANSAVHVYLRWGVQREAWAGASTCYYNGCWLIWKNWNMVLVLGRLLKLSCVMLQFSSYRLHVGGTSKYLWFKMSVRHFISRATAIQKPFLCNKKVKGIVKVIVYENWVLNQTPHSIGQKTKSIQWCDLQQRKPMTNTSVAS